MIHMTRLCALLLLTLTPALASPSYEAVATRTAVPGGPSIELSYPRLQDAGDATGRLNERLADFAQAIARAADLRLRAEPLEDPRVVVTPTLVNERLASFLATDPFGDPTTATFDLRTGARLDQADDPTAFALAPGAADAVYAKVVAAREAMHVAFPAPLPSGLGQVSLNASGLTFLWGQADLDRPLALGEFMPPPVELRYEELDGLLNPALFGDVEQVFARGRLSQFEGQFELVRGRQVLHLDVKRGIATELKGLLDQDLASPELTLRLTPTRIYDTTVYVPQGVELQGRVLAAAPVTDDRGAEIAQLTPADRVTVLERAESGPHLVRLDSGRVGHVAREALLIERPRALRAQVVQVEGALVIPREGFTALELIAKDGPGQPDAELQAIEGLLEDGGVTPELSLVVIERWFGDRHWVAPFAVSEEGTAGGLIDELEGN